jgi:saccharopine dehydrogenase-like NADP-dependent oxidoreductase
MKTVRIIGGGKFGMKAARALSAHADILLIDKDEAVCQQAIKTGVDAICADGVDYLTKHLKKDDPVMIVPSVPLHLAYQWVKQKLEPEIILQPIEFPKQILSVLPNPRIGKQGEIYLS